MTWFGTYKRSLGMAIHTGMGNAAGAMGGRAVIYRYVLCHALAFMGKMSWHQSSKIATFTQEYISRSFICSLTRTLNSYHSQDSSKHKVNRQ